MRRLFGVVLVSACVAVLAGCGGTELDPAVEGQAVPGEELGAQEQGLTYYPKCVIANTLSVFPSSTSGTAINQLTFGMTFWATQNQNGRYYGTYYRRWEWHWGWISMDGRWTNPGQCTGTPI